MDFKDIIKTNRSKLGLTLDDIARYVGVSGATVSRWESGDIENIRRDKIAKLAEILRVTPSYLMGWENDSGEQDLGLTALDVAKWLNASPEMVDAVMEDMGWPDATNPEILSKISAEVGRKKRIEQLTTEINEQKRISQNIADNAYGLISALKDLVGLDREIPHDIIFKDSERAQIQKEIEELVVKFMEAAAPEERAAFLLRLDEIGLEFRQQMASIPPLATETPPEGK